MRWLTALLVSVAAMSVVGCGTEETTNEGVWGPDFVSGGARLAKRAPSGEFPESDDFETESKTNESALVESELSAGIREGISVSKNLERPGFRAFLRSAEAQNERRCLYSSEAVKGSGIPQVAEPSTPAFKRLLVEGPVTVFAEYAPIAGIMIRADDNILPLIDTQTNGDTLKVVVPEQEVCFGIAPIIYVRGPNFDQIAARSYSSVEVFNASTRRFEIDAGEGTQVTVSGQVDFLKVNAQPYSAVDLKAFTARNGDLNLDEGALAEVRIRKSVTANLETRSHLRLLEKVEEFEVVGDGDVEFVETGEASGREDPTRPGLN